MKTLVIGGTRYLGRAIVDKLAARGDEVTVANRGLTRGELPDGVHRVTADLSETGSLAAAVQDQTFDAAVHVIAYDAQRVQEAQAALSGKIGHYVQCGSTGVYAPLVYVPADEQHPTNPPPELGGFGGKLEADQEALRWCAEDALPLTILRPTNVIGAGDIPIDIWGGRSPAFFQRIIDHKVISIPDDGRTLLQPGHVQDLADAFVAALDRPAKQGIYNITCRYAVTLNRYVELVADALGAEAIVEHVPAEELIQRYGQTGKLNAGGLSFLCEHMCFTIAKAQQDLDYCPQMQPEDSVEDSLRWMVNQGMITKQ